MLVNKNNGTINSDECIPSYGDLYLGVTFWGHRVYAKNHITLKDAFSC